MKEREKEEDTVDATPCSFRPDQLFAIVRRVYTIAALQKTASWRERARRSSRSGSDPQLRMCTMHETMTRRLLGPRRRRRRRASIRERQEVRPAFTQSNAGFEKVAGPSAFIHTNGIESRDISL